MKKCFIYCRKSSEEVNKQVQSIESQKRVMKEIAQNNNLKVVDIIIDNKSAMKPNLRTGFNNMLKRIRKQEAQIIVTWKNDRLSRNPLESGTICQLLQDGVIQKIITVEKTFLQKESQILFTLESAMASEYSRSLSMNVIRGQQTKVERGLYPACAPIGYLNVGNQKGNKTIEPDPSTFLVLKKLWTILKTEKLQLADLYRIMKEKYPIYFRNHAKIISFSSFHRIFHNPFYCGLFRWNGKENLGVHKTMITQSEFKEVQDYLNKKEKTRERVLDFDFKGLFTCGNCSACITAERKEKLIKATKETKYFEYYRCTHRKKQITCKEKPISKLKIEDQILKELKKIHLPPEIIECGKQDLKIRFKKESTIQSIVSKNIGQAINKQQAKISQLENNLCFETEQDTRNLMKDKLEEAKIRLQGLKEDYEKEKSSPRKNLETLQEQLEIINGIVKKFQNGEKKDRQKIIKSLGSNWKLKDRKLLYESHFIPNAIKKAKNSLPPDFTRLEPEEGSHKKKKLTSDEISFVWRRERDSNPRRHCCLNGFQDRSFRPLSHLSV